MALSKPNYGIYLLMMLLRMSTLRPLRYLSSTSSPTRQGVKYGSKPSADERLTRMITNTGILVLVCVIAGGRTSRTRTSR
eukprot:scaffold501519_cov18-Prasinocladus_malaysianus.AAC.1